MSNDPFKPSLNLESVDFDAPVVIPDPDTSQMPQNNMNNMNNMGNMGQQPMNNMGNMNQQPMNNMGNMNQQPMNNMGNMNQQPMNNMGNMGQQPMNNMNNMNNMGNMGQQPMNNMGMNQQPVGQNIIQQMGQQDFQQMQQQQAMTQPLQGSPLNLHPSITEQEAAILSPEELEMVRNFAEKIDVTDSTMILQFGASTQKEVAAFSEKALASVRTKDLGAIGDNLTTLMRELKTITPEEEEAKGIKGFFKKKGDALADMRSNFATAEANVDRISKELENHQLVLMKDIAMFDQLYEMNTKYYKELTMYIMAGKQRLGELRSTKLIELETLAKTSGSPQDAQNFNDYANLCNRFEKKLHDLDLTRMVSIQMGPQTRLLQNNNTLMLEKLQSSIVNTIPLWKSQMVIAMGLEHSSQAAAAQKAVTDMTNQMLRQNADALKLNTINTAKEMERSVVDIETLQHTNNQLISTLDEVMNIQQEGAQKRREAESELGRIEGELRQKLLEIRDTSR